MRPRSSVTTRSWRLPLPPEDPTRLGTGPSSFRLCALPRRWAVIGSGDDGRFLSDGIVLIRETGPRAGEAGRRGIFPLPAFFRNFQIVKLRDISGTGSQCPLVTSDRSTGLEGAGIADQNYRQLATADTGCF